jgi:hypothetical protein
MRLGTALPQDRESAFFVDGDWLAPNRATGVDARVEPGAAGTFTFELVAPSVAEATTFDEAFQPVADDLTWFGPEAHVVIRVVPAAEVGGCSTGRAPGALLAGLLLCLRRRRRRAG